MKKSLRVIGKSILYLLGFFLAVFVLLYLLTGGEYEVAKTVEQDPTIPHISIKETVFHAETFGNDTNEVVVALHGLPKCRLNTKRFCTLL